MKPSPFRKTTNGSKDLECDNIVVQNITVENELIANGGITLPGVVLLNEPQTLTSKTMNGEQNTFLNISNSSLSSGIDATKISSGLVSNSEFDYLNNVTSNIQTQLNDRVTLSGSQTVINKVLAYGSNSMTDVCSLNTTQTIALSATKDITGYLNCHIVTGSIGVRTDNSDGTFRHNISYGSSNASLKVTTSDNAAIYTGLEVGIHPSDIRSNTFVGKFLFNYLSTADTSRITIENVNLLDMASGKFNLNNLNKVDIGTSPKIGSIRQDASQSNNTYITYLPTASNVELKYLESMSGSNIQTQLNEKVTLSTNQSITGVKTYETAINNTQPLKIKSTTSSIVGLSFENVTSANPLIINRNNNDLSIISENVERFKFQSSDSSFNLVNGGNIQYNGVPLKDVSESLTGKTISFSLNNLSDVCSTNTNQSIIETKNFTPLKLLIDNQVVPKNRVTTSGPGLGDDETQGYSINSMWYRSNKKSFYIAQSVSTGNANWINMNVRQITFSYYEQSTTNYMPAVYFMSGVLSYNNFTVFTFSDGDCYVRLYNNTANTVIAETSVIPAGNHTTTTVISATPVFYPQLDVIRCEIKSVVGGETSGIFTLTID